MLIGGAAGLVVLIAVVVAIVLLTRGDKDAPNVDLDVEGAAVLADEACEHLDQFERLVRTDAGAQDVFDELDSARRAADQATRLDPRWVRLASGIQSVNVGLRADDTVATRTGIDLARTQCAPEQKERR